VVVLGKAREETEHKSTAVGSSGSPENPNIEVQNREDEVCVLEDEFVVSRDGCDWAAGGLGRAGGLLGRGVAWTPRVQHTAQLSAKLTQATQWHTHSTSPQERGERNIRRILLV